MTSGVALSTHGLVKRFGALTAVGGVDLQVHKGECFGLLGPNGAGKTTTVEILEGLTEKDGGDVVVLGRRWDQDAVGIRARIGVALQHTELSEKLTVRETLRLFRSFYAAGRGVDDVVAELELGEKADARIGGLSGGQKQRVALATALVGDPEIVFLDEPTTGLDPQARLKVWQIVQRFKQRGGTVVLTTHYMEEAARLCDRIAILDHGKVIARGTPDELIALLGARFVVELVPDAALDDAVLGSVAGVKRHARKADAHVLFVDDAAATLPALLAAAQARGVAARRISTREADLEDVFVHLTGAGLRDEQ